VHPRPAPVPMTSGIGPLPDNVHRCSTGAAIKNAGSIHAACRTSNCHHAHYGPEPPRRIPGRSCIAGLILYYGHTSLSNRHLGADQGVGLGLYRGCWQLGRSLYHCRASTNGCRFGHRIWSCRSPARICDSRSRSFLGDWCCFESQEAARLVRLPRPLSSSFS